MESEYDLEDAVRAKGLGNLLNMLVLFGVAEIPCKQVWYMGGIALVHSVD